MHWLDHQLIQRAVQEADERRFLEKLLLNVGGGVAYLNSELKWQLVNPMFARLWHRVPEDFIGKQLFSQWDEPPEDLAAIFEAARTTRKPQQLDQFLIKYSDNRNPASELKSTYWDGTITPIFDEADKFAGLLVLCLDVTDSASLQEEKNQKAAIVDGSLDAIIGLDLQGIITSWNSSAQRIYGYTQREVIGRSISITAPDDRAHETLTIVEKIGRGERVPYFFTVRLRKSKAPFPACISISPVLNSKRHVVGAAACSRDMSENIQEFLSKAAKTI